MAAPSIFHIQSAEAAEAAHRAILSAVIPSRNIISIDASGANIYDLACHSPAAAGENISMVSIAAGSAPVSARKGW